VNLSRLTCLDLAVNSEFSWGFLLCSQSPRNHRANSNTLHARSGSVEVMEEPSLLNSI